MTVIYFQIYRKFIEIIDTGGFSVSMIEINTRENHDHEFPYPLTTGNLLSE